jgi:hypothetical protein
LEYDRLVAKDFAEEVRQRKELEVSWNKEHASFLEAKKRRTAARVFLDVGKSTVNGLQGEVDEVRARIPAMKRVADKIGKECEEGTKKADLATEQADAAIAALSEARDDAEETTASCDKAETMDDKNDCVMKLGDSKKKVKHKIIYIYGMHPPYAPTLY